MSDENDNKPSPPPVMPKQTTADSRYFCPHCNYELISHQSSGRCPECGNAYTETTVVQFPKPGVLMLLALYGWLVPIMLIVLIIGAIMDKQYGGMIAIAIILIFGMPLLAINGIIMTIVLINKQRNRFGKPNASRGLGIHSYLGKVGVVMIVLFTVAPALASGGCILLLVGSGF